MLPNSFYEGIMTLVLKPDKNSTKKEKKRKENYRYISLMNIVAKNPQQNTNKVNSTIY